MVDRFDVVCYAEQAREGGRCAQRRCRHAQCRWHCAACIDKKNHGREPVRPAWLAKAEFVSEKITLWRKAKARKAASIREYERRYLGGL